MKKCEDIMTGNPRCLFPSDTAQAAARQMRDEDVGSILICEPAGKLVGIVTDRDIVVKCLAQGLGPETALEKIMTRGPVFCLEDDDADRVVKLMAEHQVRRLPVVDANHRLVGIVSQGDVATRVGESKKTAEVVKEVSQPPSSKYRQEHAA